MGDFGTRTDLALESARMFSEKNGRLPGVKIEEYDAGDTGIHVTRVRIVDETGVRALGKAMGDYITLDTPMLETADENSHKAITEAVAGQLKRLAPDIHERNVLVAGIGNRQMSPDALGPLVADHLFITRHLLETYGRDAEVTRGMGCVSALAPGVMAQTGMETGEILRGAIKETRPDLLIVVDSLAARSVGRLNRTIQMTDTGIAPGAGIGNRRYGISKDTVGIPVIAIGIPTVIDAAAIVSDTMERMLNAMEQAGPLSEKETGDDGISGQALRMAAFDDQERYLLMRELMDPEMMDMFVTPKNMDEIIGRMSYTVSEAINSLCHPDL